VLVEIQALVSPTSFGNPAPDVHRPRRQPHHLLLAVLEKRVGLELLTRRRVRERRRRAGGDEPAADLGVAAAVASSFRNRPLPAHTAVFRRGRAGGRGAGHRPGRAAREGGGADGFTRCILPARNLPTEAEGIELVGVRTLEEALARLLER
jgi:DNA repair protein RadA/Sms